LTEQRLCCCGASLAGRRRHARYCGGPCRAAASRTRAAERREPVVPVVEPSSARESAQKRTQDATWHLEAQLATPAEEALAKRMRRDYPEIWEAA
jgi:hypothetical protein